MSKFVSYSRTGAIGIVALGRAPLNLIDEAFLDELLSAFREAGADDRCRAVVLESTVPGVFCAGLDLKAAAKWSEVELRGILQKLYLELMEVQAGFGKPSIAAPSGKVRGGGITLSIQCDVIVADQTSDFAYSEIDAGLIPAIHLSHLPRQTGRHQAFTPLFGGMAFDADKAMQLGLVERMAPGAGAAQAARELAQLFAAKPPGAMGIARDAFHAINASDHREAVEKGIEAFIAARYEAEGGEGIAAFVEKRKPRWQ